MAVVLVLVASTTSLLVCLLHVDSVSGSVPQHNILPLLYARYTIINVGGYGFVFRMRIVISLITNRFASVDTSCFGTTYTTGIKYY